MQGSYVHQLSASDVRRRSRRAQVISFIGPVTAAAGVIWAIIQPYRLTILHPRGQGFWWLAVEPPLLVVLAGVVFTLVVARPLLADLEARHASEG
jgi:hypothetical protein